VKKYDNFQFRVNGNFKKGTAYASATQPMSDWQGDSAERIVSKKGMESVDLNVILVKMYTSITIS
jgi:hypothetical protein